MLAASLERISIGLLLIREYNIFFVREASSPCNGNHFLVRIQQQQSKIVDAHVRTHRLTLESGVDDIHYNIGGRGGIKMASVST